ncbi:MAG: zinc ribbon domain-containing protein [Dehalococcoidales bacterium]|nr:zinc ribbon domain-containing protein [Dehalococcoidales bacterium]
MKCPSCAREIDSSRFPPGLAFCPYCGQETRSAAQEQESLKFCPFCGKELTAPSSFCPHCGKSLKAGTRLPVGQQMNSFLARIPPLARNIKGKFGRERKVRKLYQHWVEYDALPPEEVPSPDERLLSAAEKQSMHDDTPDSESP